jgi:hypothetical protein
MLKTNYVFSKLAMLAAIASLGWVLSGTTSSAVQLGDGRIAFNSPPQMVDTGLSPKFAGARNPTYRLTLTLPDNAGESLGRVELVPFSGVGTAGLRTLEFRLDETSAYTGEDIREGSPVAVTATELAADDRAPGVNVQFNQPFAPGQTVTIILKGVRNPRISGAYSFGVEAFPDGTQGIGQFLGYARFSIDDRDGDNGVHFSLTQ